MLRRANADVAAPVRPASRRVDKANGGPAAALVENQRFWTLGIVAVALFVCLWLIARENYEDVHAWARVPNFLANPVILGLLVLVSLILAAYATAVGMGTNDQKKRVYVPVLFLAVGVIVAIVAYLTYRLYNFAGAFYLTLLALLLLMAHAYLVNEVDSMAALAVAPLFVTLFIAVYLLWYMADESSDMLVSMTPVYSAPAAGAPVEAIV
jgi:tryptophan-rich sensory protein